jgi:electron transport complex protein RnfD
MLHVCIALIPAIVMSIVYFGLNAFLLILVSLLSAVLSEAVYLLLTKVKVKEIIRQFDCSTCVTGLLIALSMGSQTPLYVPVFASAFAIIVVKMLFGGTGKNLVNPAVTGRIFAFISFTAVMASGWIAPSISSIYANRASSVTTGATVLTSLLENGTSYLSNVDLLLGTGVIGCMGETCKVALIVGGIYLVVTGIISPLYPIMYVSITGLTSVVLNNFEFYYFLPSILSGGLIFGAIFMATDYTTTPNTTIGNVVYFILLGIVTGVLRYFTKMEVVSFAILLMNLVVPLIDKFIIPKPFGYKKTKKAKGE